MTYAAMELAPNTRPTVVHRVYPLRSTIYMNVARVSVDMPAITMTYELVQIFLFKGKYHFQMPPITSIIKPAKNRWVSFS